jgi:hypothetical protein
VLTDISCLMVFPIFSSLSLISSPQILSYACSTYSNPTHLCQSDSSLSLFVALLHLLAPLREQGTNLWAEFWWIEGEHRWVFFDDETMSESYAEQLTHCPECGRSLERKALRATPSLLP